MTPARRTHGAKRRRHTRNWLLPVIAVLLIAIIAAAAYLALPKTGGNQNNPDKTPHSNALNTFTSHYLGVMKNLNSAETKTAMAARLNPSLNQTDLFTWQQSKMTFAQDTTGWYEDPIQILNSGDGICVQWSIVYVSACLSLGYQSRLVVAADASSWQFIHTWAEDYVNGTWVHVDPSDGVWNQPMRYQGWDWGSVVGNGVQVYAFQDGSFQNVTANYSAP